MTPNPVDLVSIMQSLNTSVQQLSDRINTGLTPSFENLSFRRNPPPPVNTSSGPFNPPVLDHFSATPPPPEHFSINHSQYIPPHQRTFPSRMGGSDLYRGFESREPLTVNTIRFSGSSLELESFLLDI